MSIEYRLQFGLYHKDLSKFKYIETQLRPFTSNLTSENF